MPPARKQARTLGTKGRFPGFIEPALATTIEKPPSGARWVHAIKFDGYRVEVHIITTKVKVSLGAVTIGPKGSRRSSPTRKAR
jgi:ATP-dependent DNA ligase